MWTRQLYQFPYFFWPYSNYSYMGQLPYDQSNYSMPFMNGFNPFLYPSFPGGMYGPSVTGTVTKESYGSPIFAIPFQ
ncbi:MAG: hypothetical protein H0Z32_03830 [Bacillaceae bacterium]|nr:hypothetical protein [Bacillaceae bacterium]